MGQTHVGVEHELDRRIELVERAARDVEPLGAAAYVQLVLVTIAVPALMLIVGWNL